MKKDTVIRENRDFKRAYLKGKFLVSPVLITYVIKNRFKKSRIGITTGKKTGNAVNRNRSRRIIRAAWNFSKSGVKKGVDIVFVARAKTCEVKMSDVLKAMSFHLRKLGVCE